MARLALIANIKTIEEQDYQVSRCNAPLDKPGSCIKTCLKAGFAACFTGRNEYFVLVLECTTGEVLLRPVGAASRRDSRRGRRSYSRIYCNDWVKQPGS